MSPENPSVNSFEWKWHKENDPKENPDSKLDTKLGELKPQSEVEKGVSSLGQRQFEATMNKISLSWLPQKDMSEMQTWSRLALDQYNQQVSGTKDITDPEKRGEALRQALEDFEYKLSTLTGVIDGSKASIDKLSQEVLNREKSQKEARRLLNELSEKIERENAEKLTQERTKEAYKIAAQESWERGSTQKWLPVELNWA